MVKAEKREELPVARGAKDGRGDEATQAEAVVHQPGYETPEDPGVHLRVFHDAPARHVFPARFELRLQQNDQQATLFQMWPDIGNNLLN